MKRWKVLIALGLGLVVLAAGSPRASARKALDAKWLTKPAEQAVAQNQFAKAAVLYQGAIALRGSDEVLVWRLAQIYTMGGQFTLAQETYRRFVKLSKDAKKKARAQAEIERLATAPAPFVSDEVAGQVRQRQYALIASKKAKTYARRKKFRDAVRLYEAALVMDNTLVGVFRLIGTAYGKLKNKKLEQAFYIRYLRQRPGGALAAKVRQKLKGNKKLSKISFKASFPCAVYVNRLAIDYKKKTPMRNVLMPSGEYTVILYSAKYHAARKIRINVQPGKRQTVNFKFAVLDMSKLQPWARVRANGRDLGLWNEIGLPAGPYKLTFRSDDGKKQMTKNVRLRAGQRLKVHQWR